MENDLLQLSVTEAFKVAGDCSTALRSPVCPVTQTGTILVPCDAIIHKKTLPILHGERILQEFYRILSKATNPGT